MSAEIKPVSFRLEDETLQKIDDLKSCLPAFQKPNRADVIRMAVHFTHAVVFMRFTVRAAVEWLQRFLSITLSAQLSYDLPAESPASDASGARVAYRAPRLRSISDGSISQRRLCAVVQVVATYTPPFSLVVRGGVL